MPRHLKVLTVVFGDTFSDFSLVHRRPLWLHTFDSEDLPVLELRHVSLVEALHAWRLRNYAVHVLLVVMIEFVDGAVVGAELVELSRRLLLTAVINLRQGTAPLHLGS